MEINEEGVELSQVPHVTIDGKTVRETQNTVVEKHLSKLVKKITELRSEILYLRDELRASGKTPRTRKPFK